MVLVAQMLAWEHEDGESVPGALNGAEVCIVDAGKIDIRYSRANGGIARLDMHGGV